MLCPPNYPKTKPFFRKNPDKDYLYTADRVEGMTEADKIELLANEVPALTFATGHKGSRTIPEERNIDIRERFLKIPKAQWVRKIPQYEWRHNDLYLVAYPYLFGLYDSWSELIRGN